MVAKTKFRTQYNFVLDKKDLEIVDKTKKSFTEPDQNLTVRELLKSFTHGNLPNIAHENDSLENVTFEDYCNYRDLDYDLPDVTRDRLLLLEMNEKIESQKEKKIKARQEKLDAELKELEEFRAAKKKQAEMEALKDQNKTV